MADLLRELSHYYVADKQGLLDHLPFQAAQHLLDGFALEILDGDAGLLNRVWLEAVLMAVDTMLQDVTPGHAGFKVISIVGAHGSGKRCDLIIIVNSFAVLACAQLHQ